MDRRKAGNPGRRGYIVEQAMPRGRVVNELDELAPALRDNTRETGMRGLRMNDFDEARRPRLSPEFDDAVSWPVAPNRSTVRRLKAGGPVKRSSKKHEASEATKTKAKSKKPRGPVAQAKRKG